MSDAEWAVQLRIRELVRQRVAALRGDRVERVAEIDAELETLGVRRASVHDGPPAGPTAPPEVE